MQSLMGHGRGFGLSSESNVKASKAPRWGNDMHSLVLIKNPLVTECTND